MVGYIFLMWLFAVALFIGFVLHNFYYKQVDNEELEEEERSKLELYIMNYEYQEPMARLGMVITLGFMAIMLLVNVLFFGLKIEEE